MKINRHNYEEYFILYMDNELNSSDRRMVEDFIALHPDLKEELDTLLQYKLEPDTGITFPAKEELLKNTGPIHSGNYEEWLLRYTDQELSASEKAAVEAYAAANPAVQQELNLFMQTRLQPELVEFPDKASLYRKEEKVRPLLPRWWRAAAAILLLIGGVTIAIISSDRKSAGINKETASGGPSKEKNTVLPASGDQSPRQDPVAGIQNAEAPAPATDNNREPLLVKNGQPSPSNKEAANNSSPRNPVNPEQKPSPVLVNNTVRNEVAANGNDGNQPTNNLPRPVNNPYVNGNPPRDAIASNRQNPDLNNTQNALTNLPVTKKNPSPSDFKQASLTATDVNAEPEYAQAESGKKNKLRGLFRKVTRTFEKRTNIDPTDGEDRLLVAGLAIRMK